MIRRSVGFLQEHKTLKFEPRPVVPFWDENLKGAIRRTAPHSVITRTSITAHRVNLELWDHSRRQMRQFMFVPWTICSKTCQDQNQDKDQEQYQNQDQDQNQQNATQNRSKIQL